jgi:PAS domain S-box-containing protein
MQERSEQRVLSFPQEWTLQEYLAAIVESSDDAIIGKDLHGTIRSWNRGAERIFGYTAAEALGRHISMLAPPDRAAEMRKIMDRVAQGEHVDHYQTKRITKDGRTLSISLSVSPIRNRDGVIVGASKIARDITEQTRNEEALRDANARLTQANDDLEQFAYSASHDLREPLRMVATYADMLRRHLREALDANGQQYLGYILAGAERMEALLTGLRAYMQAATFTAQGSDEADSNECLQRATVSLRAIIDDTQARIFHDGLPTVRMPTIQLEQVFQNLLANALRYRGAVSPHIHIAAERGGDVWKFSVRDNGIGIHPRYQEEIFELFKRLHSSAQYPGSGLGLAICKRIIDRGGGRIWVESEPGRGATFFFTVPIGRDDGC